MKKASLRITSSLSRRSLWLTHLELVDASIGILRAPSFSLMSVFSTPYANWKPWLAVAHGDITSYTDRCWGDHEYS